MTNKRLGIAIYPEKIGFAQTEKYIRLASSFGFSRIFANLIAVENNAAGLARLDQVKSLFKMARSLGFEVIVDVNPQFYTVFNLAPRETAFFANLNVSGIRLDEDFKGVVEAELSRNLHGLKVELNASAGTSTLEAALANNANAKQLIACHNFYPMRLTALSRERFIKLSAWFQSKGVPVAAFITLPQQQAKTVGPWAVNEGMPTLEAHRDWSITRQAWDLLQLDVVDDIIIAQQGATPKQLRSLGEVLNTYLQIQAADPVTISVVLRPKIGLVEKDIALKNRGKLHTNRPDFNEFFVRSTWPRIDYAKSAIAPHHALSQLRFGDVAIVNDRRGRYKGELHIALQLFSDELKGRNVIGRVVKKDLAKLALIRTQRFELRVVKARPKGVKL